MEKTLDEILELLPSEQKAAVENRARECITEELSLRDELLDEIKNLEAQRDALFAAAVEFVRKVESGEARSVRSYAQFKQAIAKVTGEA